MAIYIVELPDDKIKKVAYSLGVDDKDLEQLQEDDELVQWFVDVMLDNL